jgi:glycosyltransferase involved in cell wall biosynthesis
MLLSVVVPVFNEAGTLPELHRRLAAVLADTASEIVMVDDGSRDGSWEIMRELSAADPGLRLLRLSRNFGHQAAITAGLDAARGDAVVVMDGDLQDPPELIPDLLARWRDGYDVVYAVRAERTGESRVRLLSISVFYKLLRRIAGNEIPANVGDFRLMSRRVVDALKEMPERARFLRGMTSWVGFRQVGVEYKRDARFAGESKYPPRKLLRLALDGITSFSTFPIKLVAWLGFVLVAFCLITLGWALYERIFSDTVPQGWTSLLVVVLLLGGVQLLSLGIIGQYVARIFDEAKQRPLYFVSETVGPEDDLEHVGAGVGGWVSGG